jgi:hypothetical protein
MHIAAGGDPLHISAYHTPGMPCSRDTTAISELTAFRELIRVRR